MRTNSPHTQTKDLSRHLTQEDMKMVNMHMKRRYPASLFIRAVPIKIKTDTTARPLEWLQFKSVRMPRVSKHVEQHFCIFYEVKHILIYLITQQL